MARTRSLTDLILDCRQRANMENSTFCTDAEITEYLNQELAELWSRLAQGEGQPHVRASALVNGSTGVVAGTSLYALPADFWRLQEVEATINGWTGRLDAFEPVERAQLTNQCAYRPGNPVMYRCGGGNIEFLPAQYSFPATIYYTPCQTRLVSGGDNFDGYNGYEMAAIYGTVATMLAKEESDPSFWIGQRERIYTHIDSLAGQRDAGAPERVQDTVGQRGWNGWFR